jgi:hypothetical protein
MTVFERLGIGLWGILLLGVVAFLIAAVFIVPLISRITQRRMKPVPIPILGGKLCTIYLDGYTWDKKKHEFNAAITNFLSLDPAALKEAEGYVFQYYKDCEAGWKSCDDEFKPIKSSSDVWKHVRFGCQVNVSRRRIGDMGIYVSLECGCDWEDEHGMQIVFKNGLKVVKVGPFDGHLTNADAFGDGSLENVVYKA